MKKKILINFTDWWVGFNPIDNYFFNLLKDEFEIEISDNPDYLFYSLFGNKHLNYKCKKIIYIGENVEPQMDYCDYAFSFEPTEDRNYRLPHYMLYDGYYNLINKKVDEKLLDRKFCSFVISNGACSERNNFFQKLSKYKKVDSGGRYMNNIGYSVSNKIDFIKNYKFNICFENSAYRGFNQHYTTEKLMESCVSNTIGIYLGNTHIEKEFNTKSFINIRDFKSENEVIEHIIELDNDDDKYMETLKQPWFTDNLIPENNKLENIKAFLYKIFE